MLATDRHFEAFNLARQIVLALSDSEERYRLLFESTPQPILVYDEETLKFLTVNHAATLAYGYTRDEFLSMSFGDIAASSTTPIENNNPITAGSYRHVTKANKTIYVEMTSHALVFSGKNSKLVIVNDVTEKRLLDHAKQRMHASLKQSVNEWKQTFDAIDFPVLIIDLKGRIKRANSYAKHILGISEPEKTLGHRISDFAHLQPWKRAIQLIRMIPQTSASLSEEIRDETTGKTWSISLFPLSQNRSKQPDRAILIVHDTTKRVELENSLRESKIMSALGSVVAGVAHEVRNPLFALSSTLDVIEIRFSDRTEYHKYHELLRSQIERLTVLMEDLLEYGRPFVGELHPKPVGEIINRAIRACRPAAEVAQVTLVNRVEDGVPQLMSDARRISTVFINLIENAIQHSPSGSTVRIEARRTFDAGRQWIECLVKDTGPGITDEDRLRIFDPFFSKRRGGTGLGLAIARKIMQEHGGKLLAQNNPEGGACLIARFPTDSEDAH